MSAIPNSALISAFPLDSSFGDFSRRMWATGFFDSHVMFKKNSKDSEAGYARVVKARYLPNTVAAFISLYAPSVWSRELARYSFVHHDTPYFLHLARYTKLTTGTVHDLLHLGPLKLGEVSLGLRQYLSRTLRAVRQLAGIAVVSRTTDGLLKSIFPGLETTVIHHWTGPEFRLRDPTEARMTLGLPKDKPIVLSVSSDMQRKNIEILPKILEGLSRDYLLVRLGPTQSIESKFPTGRLIGIQQARRELYPIYFNAADVLVMPSRDEGFGQPIMEAINSGTPVVASDIPIFHEVLGENYPYFVHPDDVAGWIQSIMDATSKRPRELVTPNLFRSFEGYYRPERARQEYERLFRQVGAIR